MSDVVRPSESGSPLRVVLTGARGRLGTLLRRELPPDRFALSGLGRTAVPDLPHTEADIATPDALAGAFTGCDAVVHLAAYVENDDDWDAIVPPNVVGLRNVLEAAVAAGCRRFVFASSLAVLGLDEGRYRALYAGDARRTRAEKDAFLDRCEPARPETLYGLSKLWGEQLCRYYAQRHGMGCVCLRISEIWPDDRPRPELPLGRLRWCSHADFVATVVDALERTAKPGCHVVNVVSDDT